MPVTLYRFTRHCPSCAAPQRVWTSSAGFTRITPSCDPLTCRIARTLAFAASPRPVGFELMPADDRDAYKGNLLGGRR